MTTVREQFDFYLAQLQNGDTEAVHSLTEIGSDVLPFVSATLRDELNPIVRQWLVHAAWQTRSIDALQILSAAMNDSIPQVWKEAIDGFVAIGTPDAVRILRDAKNRSPDRAMAGRYTYSYWIDDAIAQIQADRCRE